MMMVILMMMILVMIIVIMILVRTSDLPVERGKIPRERLACWVGSVEPFTPCRY